MDITADSISYERARDVYIARGNVRIMQPGRSLPADWVAFSNTTRRGRRERQRGDRGRGQKLDADVIQFELDDLRGVLLGGRLEGRDTPFLATGEEVHKTGEQEYEFEQGQLHDLPLPRRRRASPGLIRSEEAELEIGGYGTARNTAFDVLGVPVFWLPWMLYPLLTDRASGFLFPDFNARRRTASTWACRSSGRRAER